MSLLSLFRRLWMESSAGHSFAQGLNEKQMWPESRLLQHLSTGDGVLLLNAHVWSNIWQNEEFKACRCSSSSAKTNNWKTCASVKNVFLLFFMTGSMVDIGKAPASWLGVCITSTSQNKEPKVCFHRGVNMHSCYLVWYQSLLLIRLLSAPGFGLAGSINVCFREQFIALVDNNLALIL